MSALRSSPALRNLLCNLTSEFLALNSAELPDGSTLYDAEAHTLWRLAKNTGDTFDALDASVLVRPNDQTDARWFAEEIEGSSPYRFEGYAAASVAVIMTSNQWAYLGSTAGTFAVASGGATDLFTQSATTGEITYNGPDRMAVITMTASINNGSSSTSIAVHAAVSVNNDVVAGDTTNYPEKGEQGQSLTNTFSEVTVRRTVLLSRNSKYRLALRNATNGDDLVVNYYQVVIEPL